jgi:hypothetical protein
VVQGEKFEAKSGKFPADLLRRALRRERRAENRLFGRFLTRTVILSGSNQVLNAEITLSGSAKRVEIRHPMPKIHRSSAALRPELQYCRPRPAASVSLSILTEHITRNYV